MSDIDRGSSAASVLDGWPRYVLWLVGIISVLNGAGMYFVPGDWFVAVPGVTETGPLNAHFVRDVGAAYVASGAAVMLAVKIRTARLPLLGIASMFSVGHAGRHIIEWVTVEATHNHWLADAAGVVVPAAIVFGATVIAWRERTQGRGVS